MPTANAIPHHIQQAIAAIAEIAPDLAGRLAAFAVRRTTRRPLRARDEALLAQAEPLEIRHGRQRIAAWSWGDGPTVHLVHGWNGRAAQLGAFVRPLVASGMRVIAHDSVGHGASTGSSSHVVTMADTLMRVVDATGPARAIIGHSLGGAATAIALSRGLVVARATLIAAPADTSRWPEDLFALTGEAAERARVHAEEHLRSTYARLSLAHVGRSIRAPILVVHDETDDVVPFADALVTVRAIRDAGLIATSGLGHTKLLRDQPTIDEIVRFTSSDVEQRRQPKSEQTTLHRDRLLRGHGDATWQAA